MDKQDDKRIEVAFGKHLRSLRENKGLTMLDLSSRIPIETTSLRRIEKGKVNTSIKMVVKLAIALEITPSELFDFQID
ncbi:MAG: helix-turn-helix transcriptional regulator [Fluviicola sp.]|nr:helix-turn-helix transcriptional regulator [Fluviicola sp.]